MLITKSNFNKCGECKNLNLCKWVDDMKELTGKVEGIRKSKPYSPVDIYISCDYFERKAQTHIDNGYLKFNSYSIK